MHNGLAISTKGQPWLIYLFIFCWSILWFFNFSILFSNIYIIFQKFQVFLDSHNAKKLYPKKDVDGNSILA
jgi:hypothetical protein